MAAEGNGDVLTYRVVRSLTRKIDQAFKSNDLPTADRLMGDQRSLVLQRLMSEEIPDGQPRITSAATTAAHPEVQLQAAALQIARRQMVVPQLLQEHGWGEIETYANSIVQRYKDHNKANRVMPQPGMSEEELAQLSQQFEPVRVDPNEIATLRQRIVKLDNAMKAQVGTSVFNDPRTSRIARMLNAEAGPGTPGYLQSKPQDILAQMPLHERALMPVREAAESFADAMMGVGAGVASTLERLGVLSLDGLTQGKTAAYYNQPTSWVQDQDGSWYHNGGKVGAAEGMAALWYSLTGNLIDQEMAEHADVRATARMRASGIEGLAMDTGHVLGSLLPFASLGGGAMAAGSNLMLKGLGWLATGGRAAANLEKAATMVQVLSPAARLTGAAGGLGAYEAMANGHIEGYGAAFLQGAAQAPVLMTLGAMGKGVERLLGRTTGMPETMARTLAGAAEGAGFAGIDPHTWDLAWDFIRNPNEDTRAALFRQTVSNMAAMAMMKLAGGRSPGEQALPERAKAEEGEGAARTAAGAGVDAQTYQRYGDLMRRAEVLAGKQPEAAQEHLEQAQAAEGELRTQAAGIDRPPQEQLQAGQEARERLHEARGAEEGPAKYEALGRFLTGEKAPAPPEPDVFSEEFRQQLRALQAQPSSPEKSAQIKALQARMKGEMPRMARGAAEAIVEPGAEQVREVFRGSKVVHQLLGKEDVALSPEQRMLMASRSAGEESKEKRAAAQAMEAEVARETFLEEGPDPLESPRFRDLPPDLQRELAAAPDARGRREVLADWKPSSQVTEEELQALGAEPPVLEKQYESSTETVPEAVRREPSPPGSGTPASLRMRPQLELEGVPGTEPIRESDILREMQGFEGDKVRPALHWGIGIRGRYSTKGMLAFYDRFRHAMRMPEGETGINVILGAHEWSHAMEGAVVGPRGAGMLKLGLTKEEAAQFGRAAAEYYPGFADLPKNSQRSEAWAEFWARWMLDDPILQKETGAAYDKAMQWLAKDPTLLRQMQRIQGALRQWRDIGATKRVASTVQFIEDQESAQQLQARGVMTDTTPARAQAALRQAWRAMQTQVVHDTLGLERAQVEALTSQGMTKEQARDTIREAGPLADPAREIDLLQRTAPRIAERFMGHGTVSLLGKETGESFKDIFNDIGAERWRDFTTWMVAQHSLEISAKGKTTNAPLDDLLRTVTEVEDRFPEVRGFADRIRGFFDRVFDYAVEGGLFTREQVEKFKRVQRDPETGDITDKGYQYYIPFDRVMEGPQRARIASLRGPEVGSSVRHQTGSTHQEIQDPRESVERLVGRVITDVHRGMAMKALLKFGLVHQKTGGLVTEVARDRIPRHVAIEEVVKALTNTKNPSAELVAKTIQQIMDSGDDLGGAITLWGQERAPKGARPVVAYTPHFQPGEIASLPSREARQIAANMDGKVLWLEVNQETFERMRDLGTRQTVIDGLPPFWRGALTLPASLGRLGGTVLNPVFALAQIIPDSINKFLFSDRPMPFGIFSALGHSIAGMVEVAKDGETAKLWRNLGGGFESTFSGSELTASKGSMQLLERVSSALARKLSIGEQGPRLDEFKYVRDQALASGKSELEANQLGMEAAQKITVDFARGGTVSRAANQIIAYLKAPINATEQAMRMFGGIEGKEKQQRALMRGFLGLAAPSIVLWWLNKDEPWYQDLTEQDRASFWWFRLPGIDAPFRIRKRELGMLFGSTPEALLGQAVEKHPLEVGEFVKNLALSFLPSNIVPNIAAPELEWMMNRSLYSGRPTVPDWMLQGRVPAEQMMPYTREPAVLLGQVLNLSPAKIDRFLDTASGGLYGRAVDITTDVATLGGAATKEGFSAGKLPLVGRAFMRENTRSRAVEDLYDLQRTLQQQHGSGLLGYRGLENRNVVNIAVTRIAELHRNQRAGRLTREQADQQVREIAQQAMARVNR